MNIDCGDKCMEQLKIEKMRQFYDIFPYPNRPIIVSPNIRMQLTAHGGFSSLIAQKKLNLVENIWLLGSNISKYKATLSKDEYIYEIRNSFSKLKRILLVGCGTDEPLLFRKLHPQNEIIGIDLSRKAIQKAKKKLSFYNFLNIILYHKKLKGIEFLLGEAEMVLSEKALGNFDYIQCFGVLHHQPDPVPILSAMIKRMTDGGFLRLMVYSYYGRKLERRIQRRYSQIWSQFLQKKRFKFQLFYNYFLLRIWQLFNFMGLITSTAKRFHYLGPGSASVADALMHPCDPGFPLSYIYDQATRLGLELIYCEGKLENEGYILGFENPVLSWNKIVEGDKKQELLTNPILIFRKANQVE